MMDITPTDVASAWDAASLEYGAIYRDKRSAIEAEYGGRALAWLGIISPQDWARACTTIGPVVYLPWVPGSNEIAPVSQLRSIAHELTHVRQSLSDALTYASRYLTDDVERASYEAYAQYAAAEILWWARGERLDVDAWELRLQRSYACGRAAAAHGAAMLTQHLDDVVTKGGRSSAVAEYLIRHIEGRHR